jgi:hypothetical protein
MANTAIKYIGCMTGARDANYMMTGLRCVLEEAAQGAVMFDTPEELMQETAAEPAASAVFKVTIEKMEN